MGERARHGKEQKESGSREERREVPTEPETRQDEKEVKPPPVVVRLEPLEMKGEGV